MFKLLQAAICVRRNKQFRLFSTNLHHQHLPTETSTLYFPYGKADFESTRRKKQFYVDKTHLIPLLEQCGDQLFFVRPPRWGKSLLLSMLASYYDVNNKDQFDELFTGLWVGNPENQTLLKSQFHVLRLDFSIDVSGSSEDIKQALFKKINSSIRNFVIVNGFCGEVAIDTTDALVSFDNLVYYSQRNKFKLMVLVDEYDRFANKLMFENPDKYKLIIEGKRGDVTSSPICSFFERLKQASTSGLIDFRSLIVGITPLALADASGYNVAENISLNEIFGDSVGFTESHLRLALTNIGIISDHQNNAISLMKRYYNGYHFPGSTQTLFNPTLSLYFLKKLMNENQFKSDVIEGKDISLLSMTDSNTTISQNVFATLASAPVSNSIVQQLTSTNRVTINNSIVSSFKLREIIDPPTNDENIKQIWDNTLSFMYYHGILTLPKGLTNTLTIPNEITKLQYLEQLKMIISLNENIIEKFINYPTEDNLNILFWGILEKQDTIFDNSMSEGGLKGSIEAALRAQNLNQIEIIAEKECLVISTENDVFLIEFKRVRPNSLVEYSRLTWFPKTYKDVFTKLLQCKEQQLLQMKTKWNTETSVTIENILNNAISQVKQYEQCEANIESNKGKTIHSFVVVQVAWPIIVRKVAETTC